MTDDDLFAEEPARTEDAPAPRPWQILIVDDDDGVHAATKFALRGEKFRGRGFAFHDAYSAEEGLRKVREIEDLALIFLDVVMETDDAGLIFAHTLRDVFGETAVRIVLRTGQPGTAPERRVIVDYDINDYKEKTELTTDKLFVSTVSALRAYDDIRMIERLRDAAYQDLARDARAEEAIFDRLPLGLLLTDAMAMITRVNGAACALLGRPQEEVLGQPLGEFLPPEAFGAGPDPGTPFKIVGSDVTAVIDRIETVTGEVAALLVRLSPV